MLLSPNTIESANLALVIAVFIRRKLMYIYLRRANYDQTLKRPEG